MSGSSLDTVQPYDHLRSSAPILVLADGAAVLLCPSRLANSF